MDDFKIVIDSKEHSCTRCDKVYVELDNSVERSDIVTWECFKESIKDILWDTDDNDNLIIGDIKIYGKNFIMFLNHDTEYNCYSWSSLFIPDSLEPNKEIKRVNVRPADYVEDDY